MYQSNFTAPIWNYFRLIHIVVLRVTLQRYSNCKEGKRLYYISVGDCILSFCNTVMLARYEKMVMEIERWYSVIVFIIVFTLILVLAAIFTLVFLEIRKILFRHQRRSTKENLTRYNCKKQRRVLYTFGLMHLLFTLTIITYFTVRLIFDLNLWKIPPAMYTIMGLFKETVAFLNPILYIIRNYEFRLASTKMCLSNRKSYKDKLEFIHEKSNLLKVSIGKTVSVNLNAPDSRNTNSLNLHVEVMV